MRRSARGTIAVFLGAVLLPCGGIAAPAAGESPRAYCARAGTDDALRPPPAALASTIKRLFAIRAGFTLRAAYYRCANGAVKVCLVGADLPCGKANTRKNLPAVARWCETHPDREHIPLYVTGHDSLYSWHCVGAKAATSAPKGALDPRGFFAQYWKTVE
jgi:hypothetical protein